MDSDKKVIAYFELVSTDPPTTPVVVDDGAYTNDNTQLHGSWSSSDNESGIAEYQYAIGITQGGTDVVGWTSVGTATAITKSGLTLSWGNTYYFAVKAKNGAGLWSDVGTSNGITAQAPPPPTITSISPKQGALEQTFYVTITGTNFTGATIVSFGAGVTVNSYSVDSATQMTANISIAGDAAPGARDVSVTGPVGTGALPDGLRVTVPLVNIAPLYGIASADATYLDSLARKAIDGDYSSLWGAGGFGSSSNPHWWKVDLQQNRQVSEIVVNSQTWSTGDPSRYLGCTNVYNLYVSSDGSSWTLIGSGTIAQSTDPEVYSDRHILSDQMPAFRYVKYEVVGGTHWAHLVEMEVLVDSGTDHPQVPTVTSVNPDHGAQGQTLAVTINGTNFTGATAVSFGPDVTVNSFTVDSASQITANISISAVATTGARTVVVNGAYLQSGFMVTPLPPLNVTSISPKQGALEQTFYVTIIGTNFTGATVVSFGAGITVNSYSVNSATQITAKISIASDAAPGARDVSVTGPVGTGTLPDGLRVTMPLVNIAPLYGTASADVSDWMAPGGAIDGDYGSMWNAGSHASSSNPHWLEVDLQQNRQVREIAVNSMIWWAGDQYPGLTNVYNLYVSSDGSSWTLIGSGTLTDSTDPEAYSDRHILSDQMPAFRYVKYEVVGGTHWAHLVEMEVLVDSGTDHPQVPTVTSVNPDHGAQGQTLAVTINGTNFTGATAVSFGPDVTVNSFTVDSASQITAYISISAAATTGAKKIVVNGAYLQSGFMVTQA